MRRLPYIHSPEEGTAEASEQPWVIHMPVQPMPWPDASIEEVAAKSDLDDDTKTLVDDVVDKAK